MSLLGPLVVAGVALDALLGEPRRHHPLVGFGNLAAGLERRLNNAAGGSIARGALAWMLAVVPPVVLVWWLAAQPVIGWLVSLVCLYAAIGWESLGAHARPVARALERGDLTRARELVGRMVSRDTRELDEEGVARATVESVLENGSDAVFAALFWFAVAGAPGVVLYRLANTLDAMWGYRSPRFLLFGRVAARLDDLLNFIPARLVALSYALCGNARLAWRCWRKQAPLWDSPNAGPVMAAGAGALGRELGGPAMYHGRLEERPLLGEGPRACAADIDRALTLVRRSVLLWVLVIVLVWGLSHA
ncbi:adenosylcobinamide-phosphate synthase CbiB [Halopseudomonas sp.]|uniref:adenosylcobinamide-phosphate synthase CbiB n=1 Tax=Halopseudomonas sp. TaxID=2901191 RepID=UPI00311DBA37